jgi:hypothetical protein
MCNLKYWIPEDEPELGSKHVGLCYTINSEWNIHLSDYKYISQILHMFPSLFLNVGSIITDVTRTART